MYCTRCGTRVEESDAFCYKCGAKINKSESEEVNYYHGPGRNTYGSGNYGGAQYPPTGAYSQPRAYTPVTYPPGVQKSKIAAGLLALFLGPFGAHNFYLRKTSSAVTQLVFSTLGLFIMIIGSITSGSYAPLIIGLVLFVIGISITGLWAFVEMIMIFTGGINTDGKGIPLV